MAGRKKHVRGPAKRKSNIINSLSVSKKQRKHFKEYGESHPADERDTVRKYTRMEDKTKVEAKAAVESSDEEEENPYHQLLTSIEHKNLSDKADSGDEDDSDTDLDLASDDDDNDDDSEGEAITAEETNKMVAEEESRDESDIEEINQTTDQSDDHVDEEDPKEYCLKESDPFTKHFEVDISEKCVDDLANNRTWEKQEIKVPHVGRGVNIWHDDQYKPILATQGNDLKLLHVKHKLCKQVLESNQKFCKVHLQDSDILTRRQLELFRVINNYQDLYYPERCNENGEEIRLVYCLHALNHVLKTRSRVVAHNTKIRNRSNDEPDLLEHRDQGLTRPKVLIVLPFRESALRTVNLMTNLLMPRDQTFVSNKKRFQNEYGESGQEPEKKGLKPEDYEATFAGNLDDHFRIGLGVAKKTLKLYTDFYSSDIILASPLGLRTMIGSEEENQDCDFLSSIEVLIFDQTDIFLMQNWDHVQHILDHLHLQPKEGHGVDFSRVRMWTLNGWSKYYRQTLLFSGIVSPEINSLFNKSCHNYAGKISISKSYASGTICQIVAQIPQVFQRIDCQSFTDLADARFEFFIKKVLPHHKDPVMCQTLIFIPSYFDYVRVRNYFVKEDVDFVNICEYSNSKVISKSRNMFFHGKTHFMLYTERVHFYRRFKLRGIKHLVFYALPQYDHLYSEMCNMMRDPKLNTDHDNFTCSVVYSKYEAQKLAALVGTDRASRMLNTQKSVHMFVTGETS